MALPNLATLCADVDTGTNDLQVVLPGGGVVRPFVVSVGAAPTQLELAMTTLGELSPAMAALGPFFTLLDVAIAVKKFADAVPDALGPPPDPASLAEAISELARTVDRVLAIVPQLSVPIMARGVVDTLLRLVDGMVTQLEALAAQQARIDAVAAQAVTITALVPVVSCAQDSLDAQCANVAASVEPANALIAVLNALLELAGLDPVPAFSTLSTSPAEAAETLAAVRVTLDAIRALLLL